jgi:hypothetical protein
MGPSSNDKTVLANGTTKMEANKAEPTAEADWGRHPGFPNFNVLEAVPGA